MEKPEGSETQGKARMGDSEERWNCPNQALRVAKMEGKICRCEAPALPRASVRLTDAVSAPRCQW